MIGSDQMLDHLRWLCEPGGSSDQPDALTETAERLAQLMRRTGLQSEIIPTDGAPLVLGQRSGRAPWNLLLYHHYDLAPAGSWRLWNSEPASLAERDGAVFGRGVAAGRGPLTAHLAAIQALLQAEGELPYGIVIVAEGEALRGSPHLSTTLNRLKPQLSLHGCIASAGERDRHGVPICYGGAKGLLQLRLRAQGPHHPLSAGSATSVPNPLWQLIWALSQIKSDQEEILITDFYRDVDGPSRDENQRIRKIELDEQGRLHHWGLQQFLFGMSGPSLARTESTLPTCNVSGIHIENAHDLPSIPVSAYARIDFQLVPHQDPQQIHTLLQNHLEAKGLGSVQIELVPGSYPAHHTSPSHPLAAQLLRAVETVAGSAPHWMPLGQFCLPLSHIQQQFQIPAVAIGCARANSATYGPNEQILIDDLVRHGQTLIELCHLQLTS